jgi:hypothetical protein
MLFRKTVAVEHTDTLCGQNAECVKADGTHTNY